MRKILWTLLLLLVAVETQAQKNVYGFKVVDEDGKQVKMKAFKGKVLLIVNTATKCGFTPQYKELEALYEQYRDQGFEILDFPCNQFGQQAPGSIEEIHAFCTATFNIQFPQFDKIEVNGPGESPLYTYLKSQQGFAGFDLGNPIGARLHESFSKRDPDYAKNPDIKWNFTKFLIDRKGKVVKRFEPTATSEQIEAEMKKLL